MTMIERVARAILPQYDRCDEFVKDCAMTSARAAIEAMREPTEAMVTAAYECRDPGFCDEPGDTQTPEEGWGAMIDAALKEASDA